MIAEQNQLTMNTSLGQWTECSNSANVETFTFEIHVGNVLELCF